MIYEGGLEMQFEYGSYGFIAQRDIEKAERLALSEPDTALFLMQQALEKMMKHIITLFYEGNRYVNLLKTRNLKFLASHSGIPGWEKYREFLSYLSDFYFEGRYPGIDFDIPSEKEAEDALPKAKEFFAMALEALERKEADKDTVIFSKMNLFEDE